MFLYLQHINLYIQYTKGQQNRILCVRISLQNVKFQGFGHFWGRRGSPRAHTLGKWRHEVHEPFYIGLGPQKLNFYIKNGVGGMSEAPK